MIAMNNENETKQLSLFEEESTLVNSVKTKVVNKPTSENTPKKTTVGNKVCPGNSMQVEIPKDTNLNLIDREWLKYQVQANGFYPEGEPLLKIGDCPFVSRGDVATIMGKPKSCKTFLVSALCGAAICGEFLNITSELKNPKLMLFDTEQGKARSQKVLQRINKICGNPPEQTDDDIIVLSIRELSPEQRLGVIQKAIIDNSPDMVCIDGGRDLLNNFNDIDSSYSLMNELMRLSTECQCGIIVVIHQNKGDGNARGHLGSELMNKSVCVAEVKRSENGIVTVSPAYCRDVAFDEFGFRINEAGLPESCDVSKINKENEDDRISALIVDVFGDDMSLSKDVLLERIVAVEKKSLKTAQRRIKKAEQMGVIQQIDGEMYELIPD